MSLFSLHSIELDGLRPADNLLQSTFWARFKRRWGWEPLAYRDAWSHSTVLVLLRTFAGGFTIAYVPHGPDLSMLRAVGEHAGMDSLPPPEDTKALVGVNLAAELLDGLSEELRRFLPGSTGLLRFDPRIPITDQQSEAVRLRGYNLLPGAVEVQPATTLLVSLEGGRDAVLGGMKSKWRYNIRLAGKRGVTVRTTTLRSFDDDFDQWYALYEQTAKRDRIVIHPADYYREFIEESWFHAPEGNKPTVELLLAEHEEELLAGIITARIGNRATYVFGASSNHKRNLMPTYALQWEAMQRAIDAGCTIYDMYGLPPAEHSDHPMHGLYRFKTGFGGEVVRYIGTVDRVFRPVSGRAFRKAERLRNYYYKRFRKRH